MRDSILLVDDDRQFREEFAEAFRGYTIIQASSAEEALSILKKPNNIGLVILDVRLPGMEGTDALVHMKEISPGLKIAILTGRGSEDVAIRALKGRADDYVEKPFEVEEVRRMIERLLAGGRRSLDPDCPKSASEKIEYIKEYVKRNCMKKMLLEDIARMVCLCPKYLSRIFKEATGQSFVGYRIGVQMDKARELLAKKTFNVEEVSEKLGYRNAESFIRQFEKRAGCTPSEYRRRRRGGKD